MKYKMVMEVRNVPFQAENCDLCFECGLQKVLFALLGISSIGILAFPISFIPKFAV